MDQSLTGGVVEFLLLPMFMLPIGNLTPKNTYGVP